MNLSPNFTLAQLCASSTALRLGIDNTPPPEIVEHMKVLAAGLELVRTLLGHELHHDSGYRCFDLNKAVGGVNTPGHISGHVLGYCEDFTCPQFGKPIDIVKAIEASDIEFDQVIQEGTWVHISFDPRGRRQVMTAHFTNGGKTTYSLGA